MKYFLGGLMNRMDAYEETLIITESYIKYSKKWEINKLIKEDNSSYFSDFEPKTDIEWIIRAPMSGFESFAKDVIFSLRDIRTATYVVLDGDWIEACIGEEYCHEDYKLYPDDPEWYPLRQEIRDYICELDAPVPDFLKDDEEEEFEEDEDPDVNV